MDTKLRALEKNALLPEEQTPEVKVAKEIADVKRQLRDITRKASQRRVSRVLATVPPLVVSEKTVYVANNALNVCPKLRSQGARIISETDNCAHIVTSEIFVERQVAKPSDITTLASALVGGKIVNDAEIMNGAGSVIALEPAILTRRWVWLSDAFIAYEPTLADIVCKATQLPNSKWTRIATLDEFVSRVEMDRRRPAKQRRPRDQLAIVTESERATSFQGVRQAHTWQSFAGFVQQRDKALSRVGACKL